MNITWILHALFILFGIIAAACGLLSSSNKMALFICFALVAAIFELTIPFLKTPQSTLQKPHEIDKIILTFSFQCDPISIRTIWSNPHLIDCIYDQVSGQDAEELWEFIEKQEPLTDRANYLNIVSRKAMGPNGEKKVYVAKALPHTPGYAEFVKRCNTQRVLQQIGSEIFNDWKMNFYISGEAKAYFVKELIGIEAPHKYFVNEQFGKQGRLEIVYHWPIVDNKISNILDLNGKTIEFKLRNMKYLNLYPMSLKVDFSEKHIGEDSEEWCEGLTTKSILFAFDDDSADWQSLPEWKGKHSVITKKEAGERIIWEGKYIIPNDFFGNNTVEK